MKNRLLSQFLLLTVLFTAFCLNTAAQTDAISSVAFSPCGTMILSESGGNVLLREIETGKVIRIFAGGYSGWYGTALFSPDGSNVLFGTLDGTIVIWDTNSGEEKIRINTNRIILSASYNADGRLILISTEDNRIELWETASGSLIRTIIDSHNIFSSAAFSPCGAFIVSGSEEGTIFLFETATGNQIRMFEGHSEEVYSAAFSPCGAFIVSGSGDLTIKLWNTATGRLIRTLDGHFEAVLFARFSADGTQILSGSADWTLALWDVRTGRYLRGFSEHLGDINWAAFSPCGTRIASASGDSSVKLWDISSGLAINTYLLLDEFESVYSAGFNSDGTRIISGGRDGIIRIWDTQSGELITSMSGHSKYISSVSFSPGDSLAFSSSMDGSIRFWDISKERSIFIFHTFAVHGIFAAALSPDGRRFVSDAILRNFTRVALWDIAGYFNVAEDGFPEIEYTVIEETGMLVTSVSFSYDSRYFLVSFPNGTINIYEAETGSFIKELKESDFIKDYGWVRSAVFSRCGRFIASGSDKKIHFWDALEGEIIRTFGQDYTNYTFMGDEVNSVSFNNNTSLIVSGYGNGTIGLWDVLTGELVKSFSGHEDSVNTVVFSPDESQILSSSSDGTIRLWDVSSGNLIRTMAVNYE
ncbi:MAG: WD40 repeat domain-containing protein [Treponema sp.]|nr:WD40 repeat domain-containing protein [Treponema sp.]